jgi:AcrR family transcriptional regulator
MGVTRFYRVTETIGHDHFRPAMVHDGTMPLARAGRPRHHDQRRPGVTARDEILDAAGELFTTLGYTGTSTRSIAESVGIRQASLYHYFATKDDILCALLSETVGPTLAFIPSLLGAEPAMSAAEHLHALATFDGDQLEPRRPISAARTSRRRSRTVLVGP